MTDATEELVETLRRQRLEEINTNPRTYEQLTEMYGLVFDTDTLSAFFAVQGFRAPFVVVRRLSDGKIGTFEFQHYPRYYFNWKEDRPQ